MACIKSFSPLTADCKLLLYSKLQDSPIVDFYPLNFKIDLNGKRFKWQGVALLPFVDEYRLLQALESVQGDLNEEESKQHSYRPVVSCHN